MKIFEIFKRKPKRLTVVEYDKLIDTKLERIRRFIKDNMYVRDDDDDDSFNEQFDLVFIQYRKNVEHEFTKSIWRRNNIKVVLSPIVALHLSYKLRHSKRSRIQGIRNFFKRIFNMIALYYYHITLIYEIRKVKKLFPDKEISNDMAFNIIKSVKMNKKMIEQGR